MVHTVIRHNASGCIASGPRSGHIVLISDNMASTCLHWNVIDAI